MKTEGGGHENKEILLDMQVLYDACESRLVCLRGSVLMNLSFRLFFPVNMGNGLGRASGAREEKYRAGPSNLYVFVFVPSLQLRF